LFIDKKYETFFIIKLKREKEKKTKY